MYELFTGPFLWLSFLVFFVGLIFRLILYINGLNWQMDRVSYSVNTLYGLKGALRSIFYWLLPFGTRSWRFYPGFTVLVFTFHLGLILTPILLLGHNLILKSNFGISFWTLPEALTDIMTLLVIISSIFIIMRRFALPEVRIMTNYVDYLALTIAVSPFLTGFMAFHQIGSYDFWICLHVVCGEIMLIAIPFTKLSHFLLFFLSRGQLGMDYGIKRGGMKNSGIAW